MTGWPSNFRLGQVAQVDLGNFPIKYFKRTDWQAIRFGF